MTTEPTAPVLDLDLILPDRLTVRLRSTLHPDGKDYELATADDLSLEDSARLNKRAKQLQNVLTDEEQAEVPDVKTAKRMALLIDEMIELVLLRLEPEVMAQMTLAAKMAVIKAFTEASPSTLTGGAETALTTEAAA